MELLPPERECNSFYSCHNVKISANPLTKYGNHDTINTVQGRQYKMNGKAHTAMFKFDIGY